MSNFVLQDWIGDLYFMQQTVLLSAIRGPDGLPKYNSAKMLLRWYRRCILLSAMDRAVLDHPGMPSGGSFTGPSIEGMVENWEEAMNAGPVTEYIQGIDGMPRHFDGHLREAIEILGDKHPNERIRAFWHGVYLRLVRELHLNPETEEQLNRRLGDSRKQWLETADVATVA